MGLPKPTSRENLLEGVTQLVDELDRRTAAGSACSADLTLTTSSQNVAGCSVLLPPGSYIVWGIFDFFHSVNGGGAAVGNLVAGSQAFANAAVLLNSGAANGDRATVAAVWLFSLTDASTVKLVANKTIGAGTVRALANTTTLVYQRLT